MSKKERKKADNPREGWEDGTPPPHRDFKGRSVVLAVADIKKERKRTTPREDGRTARRHHAGILRRGV